MMKRRTRADKAVTMMVSNELAQGLFARARRQLRGSGILSMSCPGTSRNCFLLETPSRLSAGGDGLDPLGEGSTEPATFSTFLRSRVSECRVTSYLAEVKLFFFPCLLSLCLLGGVVVAWVRALLSVSVSSAGPDNFLIIEPNGKQDPTA